MNMFIFKIGIYNFSHLLVHDSPFDIVVDRRHMLDYRN